MIMYQLLEYETFNKNIWEKGKFAPTELKWI